MVTRGVKKGRIFYEVISNMFTKGRGKEFQLALNPLLGLSVYSPQGQVVESSPPRACSTLLQGARDRLLFSSSCVYCFAFPCPDWWICSLLHCYDYHLFIPI